MSRPRAPVEVRVASVALYMVGAILSILALMATGVLLSGPVIRPARQGGTGVLYRLLFFNAALCLLPVDVLVIVLARRLTRGDHWAWLATLVLCATVVLVVLLAMYVLELGLAVAVPLLAL